MLDAELAVGDGAMERGFGNRPELTSSKQL
jgi:hypothetical protein